MNPPLTGWRAIYDKIAPLLVVTCIVIACGSSIGTFWVSRVQASEREARTAAIAHQQDCFDAYAEASAATGANVRRAAAAVSDAQTARDVALQAMFDDIANGTDGTVSFERLLAANRALVVANERLAKVRERNPVAPAPSTFCKTDGSSK